MNHRLQLFLESEGLSPTRFADAIGVQRSNVSHVLSGRNKPGSDFLEKMLIRYPEFNLDWFLTGKGKMYKESHMPSLFPDAAPATTNGEQPTVSNPVITSAPNIQEHTAEKPLQASGVIKEQRLLVKVLLCYSDGSFDAFDAFDKITST